MGHSLQKIEQRFKFQQRLKTDRQFFKQVIEIKSSKSSAEVERNTPIKDESTSTPSQIKQDVSKTFGELIKPEQVPQQIEPRLLVKKKKNKRLHL